MRQLSILFIGLLFFSCQNDYQPRNFTSINIQKFDIDSTSIRAIQVIDENTVYFAGSNGNIGNTKNNGKSWELKKITHNDSITPNFRSLTTNGVNFFSLSVENPALLYRISENDSKIVYQENHEKVFYDSMKFFADGKHGIAVGDPTENCASIILTKDGGETWTKIPCKNLPVFEEGEAFFAASNTNIKIIKNTIWIASGGTKSRVLKSTDKGKTWQIFETPIVQGNGPQGIYSIDFADENNGIAIGGDYSKPLENTANKISTSDGGKTWKTIADGLNPNYKSCIQYVPNTQGKEVFAVGKTGVSFSNDGGKSWIKVSKEGYYTIQFVDKNTAWLSGHQKMGKLILN